MIITRLIGGLGNQMFQYALARKLALLNNSPFQLDIFSFETYKFHRYILKYFNVIENLATEKEIADVKKQGLSRLLEKIKPYYRQSIVVEKYPTFDQNILKINGNAYLDGYWQCEKYFNDIRDILLKEFTVKNGLSASALKIGEEINKTESVSLHIRHGDYLSAKFSDFYEPASIEYYHRAIKKITQKIKNPIFFIFSDTIEWAKKNLKINYPTIFVSNPAIKDYEELILMSQCKHNIIANSTFSWWGAWLNQNPNKIIIAPAKWFKIKNKRYDDKKIYPSQWIKIN